jgi:membrane associated rhomboid family serine protease
VVTNVVAYIWQAINTLNYLRAKFPAHWKTQTWSMISDAVIDSGGTAGPLMRDFMFSPFLGKRQPHRYLTAGFLHGGILHLLCNMYALRQMPDWLETGLGWPLFITTYIVGVVAGNYFHARSAMDEFLGCLGSSGGIVALAGLTFISLGKMGNKSGSAEILRSMGTLFVFGVFIPSMSNASHIGGFLSGCAMGLLFSPSYGKSYSLRRKNSVTIDTAPRDYRQAMGFGVVPNGKPLVPLWMFWAVALVYASSEPRLLAMPGLVWKGLTNPGASSRYWV